MLIRDDATRARIVAEAGERELHFYFGDGALTVIRLKNHSLPHVGVSIQLDDADLYALHDLLTERLTELAARQRAAAWGGAEVTK